MSVRELCRCAGVIYYHFASPDELAREAIDAAPFKELGALRSTDHEKLDREGPDRSAYGNAGGAG